AGRRAVPPPPTELPAERSAEETARRMGAFARGTRSGRAAQGGVPPTRPRPVPAEDEGNPHP
ncbi:ATP-binding protein, partial [Streptomyces sp. NPDC049577]